MPRSHDVAAKTSTQGKPGGHARLARDVRRLSAVAAAVVGAAAFAAPAQATLSVVGAGTPPAFYQDSNGLQMVDCPINTPNCPVVVPAGTEAFYYLATSTLALPGGGTALLTLNITNSPNISGVPAAAGPDVFQRIRVRVTGAPAGTYTFTEPYGTDTVVGNTTTTTDVGCLPADVVACNFSLALGGRLGPFLTPAPGSIVAPAGFISDGATPTPVVDSPTGNNFFRVDSGPGVPAGGTAQTAFIISGKIGAAPQPVFNGPDVAFGTQRVGTPVVKPITITNNGLTGTTLTFPAPVLSAGAANGYSIAGGTCAGGGSLTPGTSCTVNVSFNPASTGAKPGTVTITDNTAATTHAVALGGTGGVSGIASAPATVDFGTQALGTTSPTHNLTINNTGTVALNVASAVLSGATDFQVTANNCTAVAPGASCTISLVVVPNAAGARSATLTLNSDAPTGPLPIALSASGVDLTPLPPAPAPGPGPGPGPGPAVAPLSVGSVKTSARITRAHARKQGLRLVMHVPIGTTTLKITIFRHKGGSHFVISSGFRTPTTGLYRVVLKAPKLRSALKPGTYDVQVTPGRSKTDLGTTSHATFRVVS